MAMLTGEAIRPSCAKNDYEIAMAVLCKVVIKIEYKDIDYCGTTISVSKDGDVIWNGSHRNTYYNADGYSVCAIKVPNKGWRSVRVARLVAMAYIPNPNNLSDVNHKNYNRSDSRVENLEWVSHTDNVRYSNCNRPDYRGEKNPNYGNTKLSQIYKNNSEYAKEKQSRPGKQNGRCRPVRATMPNGSTMEFAYIGECAEYMINHQIVQNVRVDSIRAKIISAIKRNKQYKNCSFEYIS